MLEIPEQLSIICSLSAVTDDVQHEVDARELLCPLPLLKAKQGLRNMSTGELLRVLATDAGSLKDFVSFAALTGQKLERFCAQDGVYYYIIRKQ